MIDATQLQVMQAGDLVKGVADRPGPWDARASADMERASVLYASVADAVAAASAPARFDWYRAGMAKNFRDAAAITHDYSLLTATSPASAFEVLDIRWGARIDEANALSERFEAEEVTGP
jgi:hypothetical protein